MWHWKKNSIPSPSRLFLKIPHWAWAVIALIGLYDPVLHLYLQYGLPEGRVATGLHMADDSYCMYMMGMLYTDFFSPFITCQHPEEFLSIHAYVLPHCWIYGVYGWCANALGINTFVALAIGNGACCAFLLWSVFRFLRHVHPKTASLAFLIFSVGGGIAGVAFLLSLLNGWVDHPQFDAFFLRTARYELFEGAFLSPLAMVQRLYYTLPIGLGFFLFPGFMKACQRTSARAHRVPATLFFLLVLFQARIGPLFLLGMISWLACAGAVPWRRKFFIIGGYGFVAALALSIAVTLGNLNPVNSFNVSHFLRFSLLFGSFLSVAGLKIVAALPAFWMALRRLRGVLGLVAWTLAGYIITHGAGWAAYQIYYGNLLGRGEWAVLSRLWPWTLLGLPLGLAVGLLHAKFPPPSAPATREDSALQRRWVLLWFLALCAASLPHPPSGPYLGATPERLLVMMGVPLAMLAASGLHLWRAYVPVLANALTLIILVCGAASMAVSMLFFQGPVGVEDEESPFHEMHWESIPRNEAEIIALIEEGVVLAPAISTPVYTDIIVKMRPGTSTLFGQGALGHSDQNMEIMSNDVVRWFRPDGLDAYRRDFVDAWCVNYIFCPATNPINAETLAQLKNTPWLEKVAESEGAVLFHVREGAE